MPTQLYYYSGSGNSLWVARQLASRLNEPVDLISLGTSYSLPDASCDRIGLVFPVHMWGLPRRVVDFIQQLQPHSHCFYFALALNAGQVAGTLLQLQQQLLRRGIELNVGFELKTPSNYILWNGAQPAEKQQKLFAQVRQRLGQIADTVQNSHQGPIEKGPWWQNTLFSFINKIAFPRVPGLDKEFWSDEKCNSCGICSQVCPSGNIRMENGRPVWLHHCEQCLACLQWCPQEALQYAQKTSGKKRYRHPEVSLADMLAAAKKTAP